MTEKTFSTNHVHLNYAESEDTRPPLLLLHGSGSDWQSWRSILRAFEKEWHIYAPDLRGLGKSGRIPRGYRIVDFNWDIVQFIREVIHDQVIVIGHSTGAMIALQLGTELPEYVPAVVLEEPGLYLDQHLEEWALYSRLQIINDLLSHPNLNETTLTTQLIERLHLNAASARSQAQRLLQADPDVLHQFMDKSFWQGFDTDHFLQHIACPVLLLHGEWTHGSCLQSGDIIRATTYLQHGTVKGFNDVGHGIHQQRPDDYINTVTTFLNSLKLR